MWKLIILAISQCVMLCAGQVFLKFALMRMETFSWTWKYVGSLLVNWQFAFAGACYGIASLLWFYILKHYPFSMAYPMISLSYVFGMFAAILFFHETVSPMKWLGVLFIIIGCFFIAK